VPFCGFRADLNVGLYGSFEIYFFPMHTLDVLLMAFGSLVPAEIVAVSHTLPTADFHGTSILTVSVAAAARFVHVQVTVNSATVQVAFGDAVTVAGGGPMNRLDDTTRATFLLSLGPSFRTVMVNVAVPFPARPAVDDDCVRRRSARVVTVPHAEALLLAVCGSDVVVEMFAVLQI